MFSSIRLRITTAFVILIITVIGVLSLYLVNYTRGNYLSNLELQLANQAYLIADESESYLLAGESDDINKLAVRLGDKIGTRITVIGQDGIVLGDSDEDPFTMDNHSNRPEVIGALAGDITSSIRYSITLNCDMMYVAVPIAADSQVLGVCRVSLPLTMIEEFMTHSSRTIGGGAAIAIIVAIVIAVGISRAISEPLRDVTRMARRMAEGDLDQKIVVRSRDEVSELAKTFNQMALKVKDMMGLLSDEHGRMVAIFNNVADGILVVDGEGVVTMVNRTACGILNISGEMAQGRPFIEIVRDHEIVAILNKCLSTGQSQRGLVEMEPGKKFLGVISTSLEGQSGAVVLLQDLTEMHRLERVRRDFIANISHELRTPLTSLKLLVETVQDNGIEGDKKAGDFLGKMDHEVDRLVQMVNELGELSLIESGSEKLKLESFDMSELVLLVTERIKGMAKRAFIDIDLDITAGLPEVMADRGRVEHVLLNLIHNALKFTPPHGNIKVSTIADNKEILVSVADTGVGIPSDELSRIFERFYKVDRSRSGTGTGLGLSIVKHIVEAHGGRVSVESTEGKGSTFTFSLPVVNSEN
jgi:two-component system phosphate regulon sensor histidine kinase PhoR